MRRTRLGNSHERNQTRALEVSACVTPSVQSLREMKDGGRKRDNRAFGRGSVIKPEESTFLARPWSSHRKCHRQRHSCAETSWSLRQRVTKAGSRSPGFTSARGAVTALAARRARTWRALRYGDSRTFSLRILRVVEHRARTAQGAFWSRPGGVRVWAWPAASRQRPPSWCSRPPGKPEETR